MPGGPPPHAPGAGRVLSMSTGMGVVHVTSGLARLDVVDRCQFSAIAWLGGDGHLLCCAGRDEPAAIQEIRVDFLSAAAAGYVRNRRWLGLCTAVHRLVDLVIIAHRMNAKSRQ